MRAPKRLARKTAVKIKKGKSKIRKKLRSSKKATEAMVPKAKKKLAK